MAPLLRPADIAEAKAIGYEPLPALELSIRTSRDCWTGLADGQPFCMFGVSVRSLLSNEGYPWLLGTGELPRHFRTFLRSSRRYIDQLQDEFEILSGMVDTRNQLAMKWLAWLGFTIDTERFAVGQEGVFFRRFSKRRS